MLCPFMVRPPLTRVFVEFLRSFQFRCLFLLDTPSKQKHGYGHVRRIVRELCRLIGQLRRDLGMTQRVKTMETWKT